MSAETRWIVDCLRRLARGDGPLVPDDPVDWSLLLETADFRRFRVTQLTGPAAKNKGLALFPRRVGGR